MYSSVFLSHSQSCATVTPNAPTAVPRHPCPRQPVVHCLLSPLLDNLYKWDHKTCRFLLVPLPQHHVLEFRVHCRRASACFLFRLLQPLCGWTHFVDQTDTQGRSRAPTLWLLWVTLVCRCFCGIVFSVLLAAHPGVALLGQVVTWCNSLTVHNAFRVLPREHTGHSKHPLPTTQEKTVHMDITRWSILKSD